MAEGNRREFIESGLAASLGLLAANCSLADECAVEPARDLHQHLLALAEKQQQERRARFAEVASSADLVMLQQTLRELFLRLIGGLPRAERPGPPPVTRSGQIDADDYIIEKLVYESLPGYFVTALLYRPKEFSGPAPGVLSPCGHSEIGKAAPTYQALHINLAKRGYVVLTYDPVGQGERSQFWDATKSRSRFNLVCGEHAVLGNPLYLLGSSLARFRIWDGMRGLDLLASLPEVDVKRLGCVGNSGGGTLTAYITALDPRVAVAAICCYITTLPRRMGNRTQADPDADPEQDIFGFVSEGIDHAGLLALCAPRPTLIGAAVRDFFPIEGTRESFTEAKRLFEVAKAADRVRLVEADERHGLTLPLRQAVYEWFERWLPVRENPHSTEEIQIKPRTAEELRVCSDGQVNTTFKSRHLLTLALDEFRTKRKPAPKSLRDLLQLKPDSASPEVTNIAKGEKSDAYCVVLINGNESRDWRDEKRLLQALARGGNRVSIVDPRGVGKLRPKMAVAGHDYADPLSGPEENFAYNAFLLGTSLLSIRVADVLAAVRQIAGESRDQPIVLCGRHDASLVVCLAAALDQSISLVATQELLTSYLQLFDPSGMPINAANILPAMLRDFGDIPDVLAAISPRRVLLSSPLGELARSLRSVSVESNRYSENPDVLMDWLQTARGQAKR